MKRRILFIIYLMFTGALYSNPAAPSLEVIVSPNPISLGDITHYELNLTMPDYYNVIKIPPKNAIAISPILKFKSQRVTKNIQNKVRSTKITYTFQAFDVGKHYIPTQSIVLRNAETQKFTRITIPAYPILIQRILQPTDFGIKIVETIFTENNLNWLPIIAFIILLILIIGVSLNIFKKAQNNKVHILPTKKPKPQLSPLQQALKELKKTHSKINTIPAKEYHLNFSESIKRFLSNIYALKCIEMTTQELLSMCKNSLPSSHFQYLKEILEFSDLVKFADLTPTPKESETNYKKTINLITEIYSTHKSQGEFKK